MKYIIVAVIIVLALLNFKTEERDHMTLTQQDSILAFGDSLTYGFGASPDESYPVQLSKLTGLKVINAGVNAETSEEGLQRLAPFLENPSVKLMILFFGGNDIMQKRSMQSLKANLTNMIQMAKAKNIDVLLVALPNFSLFGISDLHLYKEVSDEEDIPLLSKMYANIITEPSLKSDQIHPNAQGYSVMAEKIFESLNKHGWIK